MIREHAPHLAAGVLLGWLWVVRTCVRVRIPSFNETPDTSYTSADASVSLSQVGLRHIPHTLRCRLEIYDLFCKIFVDHDIQVFTIPVSSVNVAIHFLISTAVKQWEWGCLSAGRSTHPSNGLGVDVLGAAIQSPINTSGWIAFEKWLFRQFSIYKDSHPIWILSYSEADISIQLEICSWIERYSDRTAKKGHSGYSGMNSFYWVTMVT